MNTFRVLKSPFSGDEHTVKGSIDKKWSYTHTQKGNINRWNQLGSRWRRIWPPTNPESHYMLILLHEHIKWHTSHWPRPDIKDQNRIKRRWARKSPLLPWWTNAYATTPPIIISLPPPPLSLLFKIKSLSPEMGKELMWTYFPTIHFSILWPLNKAFAVLTSVIHPLEEKGKRTLPCQGRDPQPG